MRVSLKWISKYVDVKDFIKEPKRLAEILTSAGLEVESMTDQSGQYNNVVTGQILEKQKHPNADLLTYCHVDVGTDKRWIVCGAKNHGAGDKVVVALPGAVLPGNFEIKLSKIRGQESHGMLCSLKELGLSTEGDGIVILPPETPVGVPFARHAGLDDVLLDIKVTPNRADCLSHLGLAREIAALTSKPFEFPIKPFLETKESTKFALKLKVEDAERCPRYTGRVIRNLKVGPSPAWLRQALESVGQRSINNVVDVTNYVMLEIGQPLHAFDLARLAGRELIVRSARGGERFTTLDDKEIALDGSELLICDAERPVALAGIKGGLNSGVTESTRDIFLESAYFLPWTVRRTSRKHGIDTDSSYRFSRGIDPEAVLLAMNRASQLFIEVAGGECCTEAYDIYPKPVAKPRVEFDLAFVSARLGANIPLHDARKNLERVGCQVSATGNKFTVIPPGYRLDLRIQEDLGEEILRLRGYEHIPETIPAGGIEPAGHDEIYGNQRRVAALLRNEGLSESVNFGFVASEQERKFLGPQTGDAAETGIDYRVTSISLLNPLNQDLDVMRRSLLTWLSRGVAHNVRHGQNSGGLFEIGQVFALKENELQGEKRPFTESQRLGMALWGDEGLFTELRQSGAAVPQLSSALAHLTKAPCFYQLKGILEALAIGLGLKQLRLDPLKNTPSFLHPGQSARVFIEGKAIGLVGTLHPARADELEIKTNVALCELDFSKLMQGQPRSPRAKSIPKFPPIERDVALLSPVGVASGAIQQELEKAAGKQLVSCTLFDLYEGEKLEAGKRSLAYRLIYQDVTKTLSDEEVNALHQKTVQAVCAKLGLSVR